MDIKALTGLSLTDQELNEATRRLAYFAPSGSQEYVAELYDFLSLQALAALNPGLWLGHQIYQKLHTLIGVRVEYEELLAALERLVGKHTITCTTESVFADEARFEFENPQMRNDLRTLADAQRERERRVIEAWKAEILERFPALTNSDIDLLEEDLREYIYKITSQSSAETVLLYYAGHSEISQLVEALDSLDIDDLLPQREETVAQARAEVLPGFFRTADNSRKEFINGLLQSTFLLHMIQLDPKCSALVQAEIKGGTLYLDTNFLFRLVGLHSPELLFASRTLVELSRQFGYSLVVTPRTVTEYKHALSENLRRLSYAPKLPTEIINLVLDAADTEDPILAYCRKIAQGRQDNPNAYISPDVFIDYFIEIEMLLEPYEIVVDDNLCDLIESNDAELSAEAGRLIQFVEDRGKNKGRQFLSVHVAEHDAFHRLLILQLRQATDATSFFDMPYWFLTCDSKLPAYDRVRRASENLTTPFCVMTAQWLQTLRPFAPRLSSDAIVDSISSPLLGGLGPIPNSVILDVASRLRMFDKYHPVVGRQAMERQFLLRFTQAETDEEKLDLIENLYFEYASQMEEQKLVAEQAREKAEIEAAKLRTELANLRRALERAEQRDSQQQQEMLRLRQEMDSFQQALHSENIERLRTQQLADELTQERNNSRSEAEALKQQVQYLTKRDNHTRRFVHLFSIIALYLLVIAAIRPWIAGGLWWLVLSGLLLVIYISALIFLQPYSKGRLGRIFVAGFPILILFSAALPFGAGHWIYELIGVGANIGGFISFVYLLLQE